MPRSSCPVAHWRGVTPNPQLAPGHFPPTRHGRLADAELLELFLAEVEKQGELKAAIEKPALKPNPKNALMEENIAVYTAVRKRLAAEEQIWQRMAETHEPATGAGRQGGSAKEEQEATSVLSAEQVRCCRRPRVAPRSLPPAGKLAYHGTLHGLGTPTGGRHLTAAHACLQRSFLQGAVAEAGADSRSWQGSLTMQIAALEAFGAALEKLQETAQQQAKVASESIGALCPHSECPLLLRGRLVDGACPFPAAQTPPPSLHPPHYLPTPLAAGLASTAFGEEIKDPQALIRGITASAPSE